MSDRTSSFSLSDRETRLLKRYHGVNVLRITRERAYIKRKGRWICVLHNPPRAEEMKIIRRGESGPPLRRPDRT